MALLQWRIYYDRFEVDDTQAAPESVPKVGVQYIQQRTPSGVDNDQGPRERVEPLQGETYYCWEGDRWIGHDQIGLFQYLTEQGSKVVLFGREIPYERWAAISERAATDPDFRGRR